MVVTVERVGAAILGLRDVRGRRAYQSLSDVRKHYGLAAIANACTERSVVPSEDSPAFREILSRYSY